MGFRKILFIFLTIKKRWRKILQIKLILTCYQDDFQRTTDVSTSVNVRLYRRRRIASKALDDVQLCRQDEDPSHAKSFQRAPRWGPMGRGQGFKIANLITFNDIIRTPILNLLLAGKSLGTFAMKNKS